MIPIAPSAQFNKLPIEKQTEILQASLSEFAEYGYDLASTNRITNACGISKGVLFKYFGDKESLFLKVCEDHIQAYSEAMQVGTYRDVFDCIDDFTRQKICWLKERPVYYRLSMRIFKEPNHPVYSKIQSLSATVRQKQLQAIQSLLPISGLREGVTDEQALALMFWVAQGLQDQYMDQYPDFRKADFDDFYGKISLEMNHYFNLIRFGIYKTDNSSNMTSNER